MLRMLLRRCVLGAVTVAIVSAIIFLGVELLPGGCLYCVSRA